MRQVVFTPFVLISASKQDLTVNENHARTMEAQAMLRASNADYVNVTGVYKGVEEKSFAIFGEKAVNVAKELCKIFGQESYIIKDKVNDAYLVEANGDQIFLGKPKEVIELEGLESYSMLPQLDGTKKFVVFRKEH